MMTFTQAIQALLGGKRITRKEWNDTRHYALIKDELLYIHKAGEAEETIHPWIICEWDLLGADWMEI
jgi:hypothetical protein